YSNLEFSYKGQLSSADVREFLARNWVDIFINLSSSEGMPVSMMEAMSFGIPVVATRVGGVPELLGEGCGVMVAAHSSASAVAEAVEKLLHDSGLSVVREACRLRISERFDAEQNFSQIIACLAQFSSHANRY